MFVRAFTKGHKDPLDIDTDSKVPSNATQVEMTSYLKRIVPKEDWRLMILRYPVDEATVRRSKYCNSSVYRIIECIDNKLSLHFVLYSLVRGSAELLLLLLLMYYIEKVYTWSLLIIQLKFYLLHTAQI